MADFAVFPVKSWKAGWIFPATIHFVDTKNGPTETTIDNLLVLSREWMGMGEWDDY